MDLGIVAIIGVVVLLLASVVWLGVRERRTRELPGDHHAAFQGERSHSEAMAAAFTADAVRDGGGAI
ncbi:hypothetical protein LQ757_04505 [Agromyces sp. SYSU K20354]|uniref:hypothetical protein n=1 Tax=Agromyces cavernae TaxID=2898659 RepID=UPI001E41CD71|nr:hypothetical protein [Agromyces cavernae]MCD2441535.1 hypothetical protein [Agromyces cavernae]